MQEILETEELSLQYGGVAPVHLSVLPRLGDVAGRELRTKIDSSLCLSHSLTDFYLGLITVDQLENCSLEHFPRLPVYVETVAVVRPEYRGQTQLQGPGISVDGEEVGQGEVSLLGGDIARS